MPLNLNKERVKQLLREFDFQSLFLDELGWDRFDGTLHLKLGERTIPLQGVAEKKGMTVYLCPTPRQTYDYQTRCKIETQLAKCVREHLIVYVDTPRNRPDHRSSLPKKRSESPAVAACD